MPASAGIERPGEQKSPLALLSRTMLERDAEVLVGAVAEAEEHSG